MTVISQDRRPLDDALQDPTTTLLILSGGQGSEAKSVHDLRIGCQVATFT